MLVLSSYKSSRAKALSLTSAWRRRCWRLTSLTLKQWVLTTVAKVADHCMVYPTLFDRYFFSPQTYISLHLLLLFLCAAVDVDVVKDLLSHSQSILAACQVLSTVDWDDGFFRLEHHHHGVEVLHCGISGICASVTFGGKIILVSKNSLRNLLLSVQLPKRVQLAS